MRRMIGQVFLRLAHRLLRMDPGLFAQVRDLRRLARMAREEHRSLALAVGDIQRRLRVLERPRRVAARVASDATDGDTS